MSDRLEQLPAVLRQYGMDLNEKVRMGRIDQVIGMDRTIHRLIQVLSRRIKNNPLLIGDPGVGKTAAVEGLAQAIVAGQVPEVLQNKVIYALDSGALLAGAKLRGEFEARLQELLKVLAHSEGRILLFIDEIHTIVGSGNQAGGHDMANYLKPFLSRGEITAIGATTISEYMKYLEKDKALARRFQTVLVEEPSIAETEQILAGIAPRYEAFHDHPIEQEALFDAARLSKRYIADRFLPDSAIDVMDEAFSLVKTEQAPDTAVQADHIRQVIYRMTGIPVSKLERSEKEKILGLEETLNQKLVGQKEAVHRLSNAILRARSGIKEAGRPVGRFLFYGPTGVGKTYLAKLLANELYDSSDHLIRMDMSEYMQQNAVTKLIGAPPGYVGYEEGGQLTEAVRHRPYAILLLDELEKAGPDLLPILLQLLDEGRLTDNRGRTVDFTNTTILMTSNAGWEQMVDEEGHSLPKQEREAILRQYFRPEFLNRLDAAVFFPPLDRESMRSILTLKEAELNARLKDRAITVHLGERLLSDLLARSDYQSYGARALERIFREQVELPLARRLLDQRIKNGQLVRMNLDIHGQLIVE